MKIINYQQINNFKKAHAKKVISKAKPFYITVTILCMVFILFFLSSCNLFNKSEATQIQTESTDQQAQVEPEGEINNSTVVEIEIWDRVEPKEQIELMNNLQVFMENNSEINITTRHFRSDEELMDQFKAASLAGAGAEIVLANLATSSELAKAKVIRQVPEELQYAETIKGLLEISKFENQQYVVPFRAFDFLLLYYNKDLVENAPGNFNDIVQYCRQVNNPDENTWGFLFNLYEPDWVLPFVGGYQDWVYDYSNGSISLDSQSMIKTLQMLLKIYNEEKILPYGYSYEDISNAFINKNAHMIINGNWAIEEYLNQGLNFGVSRIPIVLDGFRNPTPMADGIGFMFNTNSYGKEFEASRQLVNFLMSEEIQLSWTLKTDTMPVLESMENVTQIKNNEMLYNEIQQVKICRGKIDENVLRVIRDAIIINLENVMAGSITVEDAVIKMQEDAIKLLTGGESEELQNGQTESPESKNDADSQTN